VIQKSDFIFISSVRAQSMVRYTHR